MSVKKHFWVRVSVATCWKNSNLKLFYENDGIKRAYDITNMVTDEMLGDFMPEGNVCEKELFDPQLSSPASVIDLHSAITSTASISLTTDHEESLVVKVAKAPTRRRLRGIIKHHSSFPKSLSTDDSLPVRIAERGPMKNFVYDKHGNVVPYNKCLYFANIIYEEKAKIAVANRMLKSKESKSTRRMQQVTMDVVDSSLEQL